MNQIAHSKVGASSMYRWKNCPGSVKLCEGIPSVTSPYAELGTRAHEYVAQSLNPELEQTLKLTDSEDDLEIIECGEKYIEYIHTCMALDLECELYVEHRFDLTSIFPGMFGTSDCVLYYPSTKKLHVIDYKHGAGIVVSPDSDQLKFYALGALVSLKKQVATIELTIVQPRAYSYDGEVIRSHTIDIVDLLDFQVDLIAAAHATTKPDAPLVAGEHCRFCNAKSICPRLSDMALEAAMQQFKPVFPVDTAHLKKCLDSIEPIKQWIKAVEEAAFNAANSGTKIPGYSLVEKRALRKWKDELEVIASVTADTGIPSNDVFEHTLLSPAKLEKVLSKLDKKKAKEFVEKHTIRLSSGKTLVASKNDSRMDLTEQIEFTPILD